MAKLTNIVAKAMAGATKVVAKIQPSPDGDPLIYADQFIGKPYPRIEGVRKVTGQTVYTAEHVLENMAYATLVHSSIAKGKISNIDCQKAERIPGIIKVMTYQNAPYLKAPGDAFIVNMANPLVGSSTTLPIMQSDEIFWNGQAVAVVIGKTQELANYAASLVKLTYESEPAAVLLKAEKSNAFVPDHVVFQSPEVKYGDAEVALRDAAVLIDEIFETAAQNHNAMEPHATLAHWPSEKEITVYDSTQYAVGVQDSLADIFGLKPEQVMVITDFVGGSFGSKVTMWQHVPLVAAAAKLTGRPVKLVLSREGVNRIVGGRTMTEQRVAIGASTDGKLSALIHSGYTMCTQDVYAEQFTLATRHMYTSTNLHVAQKVVPLDLVQNTFMRAPGEAPGMFALESAMDELANKLEMDPIELRLRNEPDKDPTENTPFSSRHLLEAYAVGIEKFGWNSQRPLPGSMRDGDWLLGSGTATSYYPVQQLPMPVKVRISADGKVTVRTSSTDIGVGLATVQMQHIAERFGVPYENVEFIQGDTTLPPARTAGGSAATAAIGGSIRDAAVKLTKELLKMAGKIKTSPLHEIDVDKVMMRGGGLFLQTNPERGQSYASILTALDKSFIEVDGESPAPTLAMKYSMASYGVHFCEVGVHVNTRQVKIRRFVSVYDCGRIINPKTANSQIQGGIIMGIGMALMEESNVDQHTGRLMNPTLGEYHVPVHADIPAIEVHFLDHPDPYMPMGVKPVGEIGVVGVAAAVANAVFQATGKRVRHLPITVDKLL